MAINATMTWRVRVSGNELNGGGFDPSIAGGVDATDSDSPALSLTDLATPGAGSTTLTSATGGFNANHVGNVIRISAGTNFQAGYYVVTARTDTNTVTLDRTASSAAAGSGGTGRLGGAHASLVNYANGGTGPSPAIATPLVAGNTIYIRGSGNNDPSSSDYDHSAGYWTTVSGTSAAPIRLIGYNGRPRISMNGLFLHLAHHWVVENIVSFHASAAFTTYGFMSSMSCYSLNCIFEQNGNDASMQNGIAASCVFRNSGSTTAGVNYAHVLTGSTFWGSAFGNVYHNIRGGAISTSGLTVVAQNIIRGCKGTGSAMAGILVSDANTRSATIWNNTIDGGAGDGIYFTAAESAQMSMVRNNIIANHTGSGKYGINLAFGTTGANDHLVAGRFDYNNLYNNATARNNHSAGANDIALDPQYTDTGTGDYSVGTNMKAKGFPNTFPA